jgi:hypothetical protein
VRGVFAAGVDAFVDRGDGDVEERERTRGWESRLFILMVGETFEIVNFEFDGSKCSGLVRLGSVVKMFELMI